MGTEIERKFLVTGDEWRTMAPGVWYYQGYFCLKKKGMVRVRIAGDQAFLTIKGKSSGISRLEYEYPIPLEDARVMLAPLCSPPTMPTTRYKIRYKGLVWEVGVYVGVNTSLRLAVRQPVAV